MTITDPIIPENEESQRMDLSEASNDAPSEPEQPQRGNREARYRVERNEARLERDELSQRLEALQVRELHRLAGEYLAQPADLDLSGIPLSEYLTPEGYVDRQAVEAAAKELLESRPGLAKNVRARAVDPSQGLGNDGSGNPQINWENLLKA